jgi:hypothetical protein
MRWRGSDKMIVALRPDMPFASTQIAEYAVAALVRELEA